MTDETTKPSYRFKKISVFFANDCTDYEDIALAGVDQELGFPRLTIKDSTGKIDNINLNNVESWSVETEALQ